MSDVRFTLRNLLAATFWVALGLGALAIGDVRPNRWRPNLTDGVMLLFYFQLLVVYGWPIIALGALFGRTGAAIVLASVVMLCLLLARHLTAERFGLGGVPTDGESKLGRRILCSR
jgi:hypothetical protein